MDDILHFWFLVEKLSQVFSRLMANYDYVCEHNANTKSMTFM